MRLNTLALHINERQNYMQFTALKRRPPGVTPQGVAPWDSIISSQNWEGKSGGVSEVSLSPSSLADLNNYTGSGTSGAVLSCLVPGPGISKTQVMTLGFEMPTREVVG